MRKLKLFTLLAGLFLATSIWATPADLGSGTGLQWELVGTTLTITYDDLGTGIMPDYKNQDGKELLGITIPLPNLQLQQSLSLMVSSKLATLHLTGAPMRV